VTKVRVGFIGLGDIGMPMARRILDAGYQVASCAHRRREAMETLKASGMIEAGSPLEVARQSEILITMVVDEQQSDTVLRGTSGALAGLSPDSTVIVMSTVSPGYCEALAGEAAKAGIGVLDCPVAGGRPRAEQGDLTLICGGDMPIVEKCRPVLETMGRISYCGAIGMGQVVKLANNGLVASQFASIQEVLQMAAAHGMDLEVLMDVIGRSTGASWVLENWSYLEPRWKHIGPMARKDVLLLLDAVKAKQIDTPLIEAARGTAERW
jgi:3-hydroxyisobutyrate dehydrogenase-like beta-hydroxyacid dehydrogenase